MDEIREITKSLLEENHTISETRVLLKNKGFLETEIESSINEVSSDIKNDYWQERNELQKKFIAKESLDKIGLGFGSIQFINVILALSGGSIFLIGILNGLRSILAIVFSSLIKEYDKINKLPKSFIANSGIIFGFSFLLLGISAYFNQIWLFVIAVILTSISIVATGDIYKEYLNKKLAKERQNKLLKNISIYGVSITIISLLCSAYILDKIPYSGKIITLFGTNFRITGYLISFEITAIAFIISGYILKKIKEQKTISEKVPNRRVYEIIKAKFIKNSKDIMKNHTLFIMIFASAISGFSSIMGTAYYGVFIYQFFSFFLFEKFMNIAIIFSIGAIFATIAPYVSQQLSKKMTPVPLLIFGTALTAIMPLTYWYNAHILPVSLATIIGIIGSSITGLATGIFIQSEVRDKEAYYNTISIMVTLPYLILIPIGSLIAQIMGLQSLFLIIGLILLISIPIYFMMLFR